MDKAERGAEAGVEEGKLKRRRRKGGAGKEKKAEQAKNRGPYKRSTRRIR